MPKESWYIMRFSFCPSQVIVYVCFISASGGVLTRVQFSSSSGMGRGGASLYKFTPINF